MPAYHLKNHSIPTISSPFDWILCPSASLINILERDFEGFLDPAMLHVLTSKDEMCFVADKRYGCVFLHDFVVGQPLDDPTVKAKYAHKIDNFRRMLVSSDPILFVRRSMCRGDAERFARLLGRFWPKLNWHLLVVNDAKEPDWGLAWATNWSMDPSIPYPGDATAWSWAIAQFTFSWKNV